MVADMGRRARAGWPRLRAVGPGRVPARVPPDGRPSARRGSRPGGVPPVRRPPPPPARPRGFDAYLRRTIVNLSKDIFRRRALERSYLERRTAELREGHTDRDVAAYESMRTALLSFPEAASRDRPSLLRRPPRVRDRRLLRCRRATVRSLVAAD